MIWLYFRSFNFADVHIKLQKSWEDCMRNRKFLQIPLLSNFTTEKDWNSYSQVGAQTSKYI